MGVAMCQDFSLKKAMEYLKTSLDLSIMANNLIGISFSKSAIAANYYLQGKTDLALQSCTEALQAATESGDIMAKQPACTNYGANCYYKGHLDEAEKYLLEALVYHEKTFQSAWGAYAAGYLGWTYHDMGNYDKAKKYHQQCVSILEDARFFPSWINCHKLWVKCNRIISGEADIDIHKLDELIKTHEKTDWQYVSPSDHTASGRSFYALTIATCRSGGMDQTSIDFDKLHAVPWNLAKDYALYADWFKKKGDIQGAREQLTKAIDIFRECGADGWVTRTEKALAELL